MADDDPNDQQANCILEVCCGDPDSKQPKALAQWLRRKVGLDHAVAMHVAAALIAGWDFAPKGSLVAFKTAIAALARGNDYE